MQRTQHSTAPCSIARTLDVLGDWWTPLILRECLYGVHRFSELQRWLGISRNMLARRLGQLVEQGVLEKQVDPASPRRPEYHLTPRGFRAATVLLAMMEFGEAELFEEGDEPIHLFDRETGRRVRPVVVDAETGQPLDARRLYAGPGPGFPDVPSIREARFTEYIARARAAAPHDPSAPSGPDR